MTITQKRKILSKVQSLESDIETLKRVRLEIATSGYSSASLSSGGGSKSYTRTNINDVTKAIVQLNDELNQYRSLLSGGSGLTFKSVLHVYS